MENNYNDEILTEGQRHAFKAAMDGKNLFITGGAGVGKSFVTKKIIHELTLSYKNVVVCAPTGIAANHIGGSTIHRAFGFPSGICLSDKKLKIIERAPKVLRKADVIIIDEISMVRMEMLDAIYFSLRRIESKTGRMPQLIVVGDFYQLPPVIEDTPPVNTANNATPVSVRDILTRYYGQDIGRGYAFQAPSWKALHFTTVELTEIVRQKDSELAYNMNLARRGDVECLPYFNVRNVPKDYYAPNLYAYNIKVDEQNQKMLDRINEFLYVFPTLRSGITDDPASMNLPAELQLKVGCRVILTANSSRDDEVPYVNGSLGTVVNIDQNADPDMDMIVIQLDAGGLVQLVRKTYEIYQYVVQEETGIIRREILGTYEQFPLKLAYALTIHKSQGQTYEAVNIDPSTFCAGQLYVALSRVTSLWGLHLSRQIIWNDLTVDPVVQDFYDDPESASMKLIPGTNAAEDWGIPDPDKAEEPKPERKKSADGTGKGGRPPRFPSGQKQIRLPVELIDSVTRMLEVLYPKTGEIDQNGINEIIFILNEKFPSTEKLSH